MEQTNCRTDREEVHPQRRESFLGQEWRKLLPDGPLALLIVALQYMVSIAPGVDVALIVAICIAMDNRPKEDDSTPV